MSRRMLENVTIRDADCLVQETIEWNWKNDSRESQTEPFFYSQQMSFTKFNFAWIGYIGHL